MQLGVLWQYMQVDMKADKFETKMRQSETRQKLIKQRNFLLEQQSSMKKLEDDLSVMQDRFEAVRDEAERLEKSLGALIEEIKANPAQSLEEAQKQSESVKKLADTLTRYEQELQKMRKDSENKDHLQREIRVRAAKTKQEYDALKTVYDVDYKKDSATLQKLRADVQKESAKVDPKLLERYSSIKQHCTPPMAELINGQCSGCFMALPNATLLKLKGNDTIVECDNCGRIIYLAE